MVMSYTQLLEREYKDRLGPAANQFIGYAVQGAQRMETLLKDLREFWSVNEQKHADRVPLDSEQIVRKAVDLLGTQIRGTGATVTYDSLPSSVMAEETPLTLVFKNLIANGLTYRRVDVSPTVHVSATEDVDLYTFWVKDNGIGIEAEHLKVIFAPFKRLHGAEYAGSGLGLAICQRIVERYGGTIQVDSEYGTGSTFHFTIPKQAPVM